METLLVACPSCGRRNRVPARHLADTGRCGACREALPPLGTPLDVDEAQFDAILREAPVPVLVDFWAGWCAPCRAAAPEVQRAAARAAGRGLVLKVDTERHPGLAERFGVRSIPNFVVLSRGRVVQQRAGLAPADQLVAWLDGAAGWKPPRRVSIASPSVEPVSLPARRRS